MKVTLRTYGGFAPALQPKPCEVDSHALPQDDARKLERLAKELPARDEPARPVPDERHYEITIESREGCRVVRCADSSLTDAHAALLDFVRRHGKRG